MAQDISLKFAMRFNTDQCHSMESKRIMSFKVCHKNVAKVKILLDIADLDHNNTII